MKPKLRRILEKIEELRSRGVFQAVNVHWHGSYIAGAINEQPLDEPMVVNVVYEDKTVCFWFKDEYLDEIAEYLDRIYSEDVAK